MFEKTYFVLSPSFDGATLVVKLLNARPEVSALADTYPSNVFDQGSGCVARVNSNRCPFWQAGKTETGATRHAGRAQMILHVYPAGAGGIPGQGLLPELKYLQAVVADFSPCARASRAAAGTLVEVGCWCVGHLGCLFDEAVEQEPPSPGGSAVEPEGELVVEAERQLGLRDGALVGTQQPPLDEGRHTVDALGGSYLYSDL